MYEAETSLLWEDGAPSSLQASKSSSALIAEHLQPLTLYVVLRVVQNHTDCWNRNLASHSLSSLKASSDSIPLASDQREGLSSPRSASELAGGIEDWEDVNYGQTDRYGFIISRPSISNQVTSGSPARSSPVMSQSAAETSRQRKVLSKSISSTQKAQPSGRLPQVAIRKTSTKSLRTQGTSRSESGPAKSLRAARSRLPGNQHRRWMDEAGDMLTLQPGLADIVEENDNEHANPSVTTKELERIKKWSKMARSREVKGGDVVGWGAYHFDTMNAKLVERTWKGIPDCWRAAAWHSFLSASARRVKGSKTDTEIIAAFYDLLPQSSADDVQIDLDVPRTINSHIMFRKRYRGGQRLLFRVLHCVSLYFPETRYVQGMASLAATLLCYYAEETCFVMLVRMWTLRGLEKLYAPGFAGLFAALDEFSRDWMKGHDVCQSLERQGIDPTAYGTRWYLTLFNYSIPFAAQLRVWDVFMLLGDENPSLKVTAERPFAGALDVLHAASCALIDGTREILLDSDFENSMKVLTSWVPIKDEELFMKVAKVEWRLNHKKKDR